MYGRATSLDKFSCRFWLLAIHGVHIRDLIVNKFIWNSSNHTLLRLQTSFSAVVYSYV